MIVAPAVDLRGGRCVQLVGGDPEREPVSLPDPVAEAERWAKAGFRALHVVDLDAALETGSNREWVLRILGAVDAPVQVGGGVRSHEAASELIAAGAQRVIVGTRAVRDPVWLGELALAQPGRVMVAADVWDGEVVVRGWREGSGVRIPDLLERLGALPLAGVLCTDVGREGRLVGLDPISVRTWVGFSRHPVWISGGVASIDDLRRARDAGAHGAVVGMAFYTGAIEPQRVIEEFP